MCPAERAGAIPPDARAVLDFWFGAPGAPGWNAVRPLWFAKSDATDDLIRERFLTLWQQLRTGACEAWRAVPEGACAYIIVSDQLPRNMFRGQPEAFATDGLALQAARELVAKGMDRDLPTPYHRQFCYLPFEHDESLASQDEAIRLFTQLRDTTDATAGMDEVLHWAVRHRDVIVRFGRYPHRNATLGRVSTAEEPAFLAQPGSSF